MTDEDRNRAVSLVAQGFTFKFVADEYGVFPTTISRSLRKKFAENNKWLCCSTIDLVVVRRGNQHQEKIWSFVQSQCL